VAERPVSQELYPVDAVALRTRWNRLIALVNEQGRQFGEPRHGV
jgi:hypothetical protein